jgi:hypothetical protein
MRSKFLDQEFSETPAVRGKKGTIIHTEFAHSQFLRLSPNQFFIKTVVHFLLLSPFECSSGNRSSTTDLGGPFSHRYFTGRLISERNHHYRTTRGPNDTFGGAAEKGALQHSFPVNTHHQQIDLFPLQGF